MIATRLAIPDVVLLAPKVFGDERGFFYESFNQQAFEAAIGRSVSFVQDNHSCSARGVLRGLHYQLQQPQGKLVRVVAGEVFDVAVDLRQSSPTFGQWVGELLSAENKRQMWVPEGFAHGFLVLSESAEFLYKTTDYYAPQHERCLSWNDASIGINWPLERLAGAALQLSAKDQAGAALALAQIYA
ncbi:MAG: dTDP-4-dehydrorhamnose 3,5-epimerase [Pseudomonadaceae bacterium]|nr:dTDP-4-dehydrorhamnose 3,5-epimerase [Pseudomonadaceae bacterium]